MKTLLVIDGCPLVRECLSMILRAKGHRVQSTASVARARAMIAKRPPDLILTEICLPDDNALNLMRWLKAQRGTERVRVALLTQAAAKKPIMDAIELGVCKVMLKPKFSINGFLEQVGEVWDDDPNKTEAAGGSSSPSCSYPIPENAEDPALALKGVKPIISRAELKERLAALDDLCSISEPIARIMRAIESPDSEIDEVADLIKMDQSIAMRVMRIANSIEYVRGEQATTLKDAVIRIGLEQLGSMVAGIGIVQRVQHGSDSGALDMQSFWDHALGVAVCSQRLATLHAGVSPELAFTAAILHDIGRMILSQVLEEEYPLVIQTADKLGVALELAEKRMLLLDHTAVAQSMLGSWNLPKDLVDAISCHHAEAASLGTLCPKSIELSAIVALSNQVAHAMGIGCSGNKVLCPSEALMELLETQEELTIGQITDGLIEEVERMRSMVFDPKSQSAASPTITRSPGPIFDQDFSPMYITMNPEKDLIGHWVRSHADPGIERDEEGNATPPNIAIIHVRHSKDRAALVERFEQELSCYTLGSSSPAIPVLILSPNGRAMLSEEFLRAHPCRVLRTPFSVGHFEQRINHLLSGMVRSTESLNARRAA